MSGAEDVEKPRDMVPRDSQPADVDASCPLCPQDSKFSFRPGELREHVKAVHECPICGEQFKVEADPYGHARTEALQTRHLAERHGLTYGEFPDTPSLFVPPLVEVPGWVSPAKVIRSLPKERKERYPWLLPVCQRLAAADNPREALNRMQADLLDRAEYVLLQLDRVRRTQDLKRYQRLKGVDAKAKYLAKVLADPEHAPSYAEQLAHSR